MIEFRMAQKEDVSAIVALLADDELGRKREDYRIPIPEPYFKAFDRIDKDPNQRLMVIVSEEGMIVGTFQMTFIPYLTYQGGIRAQVEGVRIHASLRGQGVGTLVFKYIIEMAQQEGAHVLQLTSDKKRPQAIHFYEKLGFVASHEGMKLHFPMHS